MLLIYEILYYYYICVNFFIMLDNFTIQGVGSMRYWEVVIIHY